MGERERLLDRLFNTPSRTIQNINVFWGPEAHKLTPEERAAEVNAMLDAVEAGECRSFPDPDRPKLTLDERQYCVECGETYVRVDRYDEAIRQRDMAVEALKGAIAAIDGRCGGGARGGYIDNEDDEYRAMRAALAACSPPLAPGDVKTGKVVP